MSVSTKIVIKPVMHRKRTWTNQLEFLKKNVIPALKKVDFSLLFFVKVNAKDFPTYPDIVKKPMDFSLIETRLKENYYESARDCIDDIETVFANCCVFSQAAEDITLISEHMMRDRYLKKMEEFPPEEVPLERKKRGPGRKRNALSPVGASPVDSHISTRRHSVESIDSQSNQALVRDGNEVSPASNGDAKAATNRNVIISRISKEQTPVPPLKVSNVPARREREARSQTISGFGGISGTSGIIDNKPRVKLSPSLNRCLKIINDIQHYRRRSFNWPFNEPVDPVKLKLPDYFQIVKHPMDLSTIKKNLESGVYTHRNQVKEHIDLMLSNCYLYNGLDSAVAVAGKALGAFFDEKFNQIPDDREPKKHKHKHHKVGKRHKRDRADEDFARFGSLSPEVGPYFLPEDYEKINSILCNMNEVLERMHGRCGDFDRSNKLVLAYRGKLNDDSIPIPPSFEVLVRQFQADFNSVRNLPGIITPPLLSNGTVTGSGGSGSGRSAGRPRKRALPTDTTDLDLNNTKVTPTISGTVSGSGGRGKRKRLNNMQPTGLDDTPGGPPSGQGDNASTPTETPLSRKASGKTLAATALSANSSVMQASHNEEMLVEHKPQKARPVSPIYDPVGDIGACESGKPETDFIDDFELSYTDKAELSVELQQVNDTALLHELSAIVQRSEPQVQLASSGDLDVDLSLLDNSTLLAMKRAIERGKESARRGLGNNTVTKGNMSPPPPPPPPPPERSRTSEPNAATQGNSELDKTRLDSDEDMEEDEEDEEDLDATEPMMAKTARESGGQSASSPIAAPQRGELMDESRTMFAPGACGDLSSSFSESDQSDNKPRGRRNRKANNPVRHRGAATVHGVSGGASGALPTGPPTRDDPASEQEPSPPRAASGERGISSRFVEKESDEPLKTDSDSKPVESSRDTSKQKSNSSSTEDSSSGSLPTHAGNKKGSHQVPNSTSVPSMKIPKGLLKSSAKSDNPPKTQKTESNTSVGRRGSQMAQLSSDEADYISNRSDSDVDEDTEKESPTKSDDDFKGRPLVGQTCPRRRVYEIFNDEESVSKSDTAKRRIANEPEDVMQMKAQFHSIIYQRKSEMIAREMERENEVRERREEEEKRKREDEERKRLEEQAKEARKEALKEQERKRLNEIRARNRRADMPLRQYADMANFEKKLDFSLLSPRWV